ADYRNEHEEILRSVHLQISQLDDRLNRLTDAYIDRVIDKDMYEQRKTALLTERHGLLDSIVVYSDETARPIDELRNYIECAETAYLTYKHGTLDEKRELVDLITSKRVVDRKTPVISLSQPFRALANRFELQYGDPKRDIPRIWKPLLAKLIGLLATGKPDN